MKNQKNLSHKVIWAIIFGEHLFLSDKKSCLEDNTAYFGSNIIIGRSNPQLSRDEHILLHHFESGYTCWRTIILKWKLEMNLSVELSAIVNSERSTCQSFSESNAVQMQSLGRSLIFGANIEITWIDLWSLSAKITLIDLQKWSWSKRSL